MKIIGTAAFGLFAGWYFTYVYCVLPEKKCSTKNYEMYSDACKRAYVAEARNVMFTSELDEIQASMYRDILATTKK